LSVGEIAAKPISEWTEQEIRQRIAALGDWFQNIDLRGVATAPHHFLGDYPSCKWHAFERAIPLDLTGMTVLDIGCNAGFYSMVMKRRGAARVVGIDSDPAYLAQARFAAEVNGLEIEWRQLDVYRIAELQERFDLVLFMGVLYHLRHPLLALDLIWEHAARETLVFQSLLRGPREEIAIANDYTFWQTEHFETRGYPVMYFVEHRYANDPTNWWIPNQACAAAMLHSAGFEIVGRPEEEVFICKRRSQRG
jgi:tRNA (mo5U34)-methyltransferase